MEEKKNMEEIEKNLDENQKKVYEILRKDKNPVLMYKESVPGPALKVFQDLAHKEFNGNYGFTLKYLIDFYNGAINVISPEFEGKMDLMEARLTILEGAFVSKNKSKEPEPKEKPKGSVQADGTILQVVN